MEKTASDAAASAAPSAAPSVPSAAQAPRHPSPFFPLRDFLKLRGLQVCRELISRDEGSSARNAVSTRQLRQSGVCDLPQLRVIDVGAMFLDEAEDIELPSRVSRSGSLMISLVTLKK